MENQPKKLGSVYLIRSGLSKRKPETRKIP